jgi:hypothetical protein
MRLRGFLLTGRCSLTGRCTGTHPDMVRNRGNMTENGLGSLNDRARESSERGEYGFDGLSAG